MKTILGVAAALAIGAGLVSPSLAQAAITPPPRPYTVGHRCGPSDFGLENAPATCVKAAKAGVPAVEIDVRDSKSGTPWVMHDWSISRTTNGSGGVIEKTDAQLNTYKLDNGEKIPTLYEMLGKIKTANPNTKVFIHYNAGVYSASTVKAIQDRVVWQGFTGKAVYMSWLPGHLKLFKTYAPAVPRLRLLNAGESWYADPSATDIMPPTIGEVTKAKVDEAASKNIKVHVSTGSYSATLGKGVVSNMLDNPTSYMTWLKTH